MDRELLKRRLTLIAIAGLSFFSMGFAVLVYLESPTDATRILSVMLFLLSAIAGYFNTAGAVYFLNEYYIKVETKRPAKRPSVAVVIATYNEEPEMVENTITKLQTLDYPKEKLSFYLLDDSTKEDIVKRLSKFCSARKIAYRHRTDRTGFKGGALNEFLKECDSEYIAIFDADEELVDNSFLMETLGHFEGNEKLAYVQTSKRFAKGSTFADSIDVAYSFFFNFVQPVRSSKGFSMFCGSCGVLNTRILKELGGFPDSVVEDAAYSLVVDSREYDGIYIRKAYALGKPIESFTAFGVQQWRYNFGNTKLFGLYLRNLFRIPLKKHFHYFIHIFGLHYLSIMLILFAVLTVMITYSDFRTTASRIANLMVPPQYSLKMQIEVATMLSIFATLFSALIISKMYFNSFKHGFLVYLMNFGIAFVRAKAAVEALYKKYSRFHVLKKGDREKYSPLQALRMTFVESAFALMFFMFGIVQAWNSDLPGAFWLSWYGLLFSTSFLFTYLHG